MVGGSRPICSGLVALVRVVVGLGGGVCKKQKDQKFYG